MAHDEGIVVVIDTELTEALRAEGDAREVQRAIQDLRREAGLELDDRIQLAITGPAPVLERLAPYLAAVLADTIAQRVARGALGDRPSSASVALEGGSVDLALVRLSDASGSSTRA